MGANIIVKCRCQARVPVENARAGQILECPRCGLKLRVPAGVGTKSSHAAPPPPPVPDQQVPEPAPGADIAQVVAPSTPPAADETHRRRWVLWAALALVGVLVPLALMLMLLMHSGAEESTDAVLAKAKTETERVVLDFLLAVRDGNKPLAAKLALEPERPKAQFVHTVRQQGDVAVTTDSMLAVTEFHASLDKYHRSPKGNFYAEGLDTGPVAEQFRKAKEANKAGKNMANPNLYRMDLSDKAFDKGAKEAEALVAQLRSFSTAIAQTSHTYRELLAETDVELSPEQRRLCEMYGRHIGKWRRFLGRDLADEIRPKLPPDAPFALFEAEVVAAVGDTPSMSHGVRRYRFSLRRFQVEGMNTGWKIWDIKPVAAEPEAAPAKPSRT